MEDNRLPKRMMTWSLGERRQRGLPEIRCEKGVERVMKQKNLTLGDAKHRKLRQEAAKNK
jgi:hypothetical protein